MHPVRLVARSTPDTLDTGATAWGLGIPPRVLVLWLMLGLAAVRLSLAALHPSFLGVDGGAYLLGMFQYIGGPEQTGIERPPLAPGFLLVPTTWLFGVTPLGFNLYAALGSLVIFPPFYLLARRVLGPTWAILAVVALSLDWEQWVLLVTGVVPVLGFGGICLALWAMVGLAEDGERDNVGVAGRDWIHAIALLISIVLIALSNQTSTALALVSLGVAWLVLPRKPFIGFILALGGLIAIGMAWPWYERVLPGSDQVAYQGPLFYLPGIGESRWYQAGIVLGFLAWGWWKVKGEKPPAIRALTALIVAHSLLSLVWSSDEAVMNLLFRSGIWQMVPFWIVAVWLVREAFQGRPWLPWALGIGIVLASVGTAYIWSHQPSKSMHMSADVLAATRALELDEVERIGSNGESRANWIAAVTGKPVVWVQPVPPSPRYVDAERMARCDLGWLAGCATGFVSHWIIDRTDMGIPTRINTAPNPSSPWEQVGKDAPWLKLEWEQGNVEIWASRLPGSGSGGALSVPQEAG